VFVCAVPVSIRKSKQHILLKGLVMGLFPFSHGQIEIGNGNESQITRVNKSQALLPRPPPRRALFPSQ